MDYEKNNVSKIIRFENNSFEMNITVESFGESVLEDHKTLKEVVELALRKGFSRFVGTADGSNNDPEFVFIFSKPNYFDKDDCLVRNPDASAKISRIIEENKK